MRMARTLPSAAALAFALSLAVSGCTDTGSGGTTGSTNGTGPTGPPPDVTGLSLEQARADLTALGFRVLPVEERYSAAAPGTVLRQRQDDAGQILLVVALAFPTIPDVLGQRLSPVRAHLRDAGFSVHVTRKVSTKAEGTVISQRPAGEVSARPGRTVTIVVAKPAPDTSGGTSSCTPGYSPCLPPASDYDCAGGSGDGPQYTGFVRVTGSDPYGLDADNDGYGCE